MTTEQDTSGFAPPYVSWTTLSNLISERLGGSPLPPRIDKGFLDNYSGSTQAHLLMALRSFGLIEEDGTISTRLARLAEEPESRQQIWLDLLEEFYPTQLKLARGNGTAQQLWESFNGLSGSTLRKAVVFYLQAVEFAGAPNSPHFKPPRQPKVEGSRSKRSKPTTPESKIRETLSPPPAEPGKSLGRVVLPSGGTVSLDLNVDLYKLDKDERNFVFGLIDQMREFESTYADAIDEDNDQDDEFEDEDSEVSPDEDGDL